MSSITTEFHEITFPKILEGLNLNTLREAIVSIRDLIVSAINVLKTGLEIAKLFLISVISPIAVIIQAIIDEIYDIIQGILDAGISFALVMPNIGKLYSIEDCFRILSQSCVDKFDSQRPITSSEDEVAFWSASIVVKALSINGIQLVLDAINALIDLGPFINLYESIEVGKKRNYTAGQSMKPDWAGVKLVDSFPVIKSVVLILRNLLDTIQVDPSMLAIINQVITLLELKEAQLNNLVDAIDTAILALLGFPSIKLNLLIIEGSGTQEDLAAAFIQAGADLPPNLNSEDIYDINAVTTTTKSRVTADRVEALGNLGAIVSFVATGAKNPAVLRSLFTGGL